MEWIDCPNSKCLHQFLCNFQFNICQLVFFYSIKISMVNSFKLQWVQCITKTPLHIAVVHCAQSLYFHMSACLASSVHRALSVMLALRLWYQTHSPQLGIDQINQGSQLGNSAPFLSGQHHLNKLSIINNLQAQDSCIQLLQSIPVPPSPPSVPIRTWKYGLQQVIWLHLLQDQLDSNI